MRNRIILVGLAGLSTVPLGCQGGNGGPSGTDACASVETINDAECIAGLLGADRTDDAGSPPDLTEPITFGMDIQPIFDKNCVPCHRSGGIAERLGITLHLSSGQSVGDLIDQPSQLNSEWTLVVPGDAESSLLYRIVADEFPPAGLQMPLFDRPLLPEEIELIEAWINTGAR